jgi:outer membrane protein assembly factor BamE (lipoprotein component of BamABCDE complex)
MKPMKCIVLLAVVALLAGCTTTFRPWLLSDVKEGMDKEQVISILGDPDSSERKDGAEYLYYLFTEGYNAPLSGDNLIFDDSNHSIQREAIKQGFDEHKYAVKFVDGKMQSYKEIQD